MHINVATAQKFDVTSSKRMKNLLDLLYSHILLNSWNPIQFPLQYITSQLFVTNSSP